MLPAETVPRFWKKVTKLDDGCWLWTGALISSGYGNFSWSDSDGIRRWQLAHRVSCRLHGREIPPGMQIDHLCRVKTCVRPDHLDVVTPRVNTQRQIRPRKAPPRKTTCPHGHPYDETSYVRKDGSRVCHVCKIEHGRKYRANLGEERNIRRRARRAAGFNA